MLCLQLGASYSLLNIASVYNSQELPGSLHAAIKLLELLEEVCHIGRSHLHSGSLAGVAQGWW